MSIQVGERLPDGEFKVMSDSGPETISTNDLFSRRRVVLVSVPGAFTRTCSSRHLPGFLSYADEMLAKGIDSIAFMAVNDVDVMHAWGKDQGVGDKIMMLADGNGDYVRALGLEIDLRAGGMGLRGQRFALIVEDFVATHVAIEEPGQFVVSSAEAVLENLQVST